MPTEVQQSLINRTGIMLGAIMFLVVVNMLASFFTAESAENDAVRINLAGSLRMQSYRISEALLIESDPVLNPGSASLVADRLIEFEERLYRPVLVHHLRTIGKGNIPELLNDLEIRWSQIKSAALEGEVSKAELLSDIDAFVVIIDQLVKEMERETESKFDLLRIIQGSSLILTSIFVVIALWDISTNVVVPMRRLVRMAKNVEKGDFATRVVIQGEDELSVLASALNQMSESIERTYRDLENKVSEKTRHLERAHDGLQLLYDSRRVLSGDGGLNHRIRRTLDLSCRYFGARLVSADLTSIGGTQAFNVLSAGDDSGQLDQSNYQRHAVKIGRGDTDLGELTIILRDEDVFDNEQVLLLKALADNLAAALVAEWRHGQQHRLVLMEERAVIARELHDSLAQSLSYLKIQISRLQMLQSRGADPEQLNDTVIDIKTGINAAYGQLRELLTTFRLKLTASGLKAALEETAAEFSQRGELDITVEYLLAEHPLSPNEEIHMLQIAREALSNVIRHANASSCRIKLRHDSEHYIKMTIEDNGVGLREVNNRVAHYGRIIMKERASSLGGTVSFGASSQGGTAVELEFIPAIIRQGNEQQSGSTEEQA
ncbi:MAG: histidine kinase [Pseudomonadales bacterium]